MKAKFSLSRITEAGRVTPYAPQRCRTATARRGLPRPAALLLLLSTFGFQLSTSAQGTAFTYQGRLNDGANPATGIYDLRFAVYDSSANGNQAGNPVTNVATSVSNGLFTVTLNFGGIFTGTNYWLDIAVRTNGSGAFTALAPRQPITPTPYAIYAATASNVSGTLADARLSANVALLDRNGQLFTGDNYFGSNLGIGTVSPQAQLNVNGTARFEASTPAYNEGLTLNLPTDMPGGGYGGIHFHNAARNGAFGSGTIKWGMFYNYTPEGGVAGKGFSIVQNNANTRFYISTNGSVGVGTNSPSHKFEVNGDALFAGDLNLSATATINAGANRILRSDTRENFFAGDSAGKSVSSGDNNTAVGHQALYSDNSGFQNTAVGDLALNQNVSGGNNTAIGFGALAENTSGFHNTAIGMDALVNATGSYNIGVGFQAGENISSGNSNICIGISVGSIGDDNVIRIGSGQSRTFIAGISGFPVSGSAVVVNGSGQLGVAPSSQRFKQNIQPMNDASDVLLSLQPVTFQYKPEIDPQGAAQFGLIAEQVEKVDPDLVVHDKEHGIYTVRYEAVNAMLVNEFLKEHRKVEAQTAQLQELSRKVEVQDSENTELRQRLEALEKIIRNQKSK